MKRIILMFVYCFSRLFYGKDYLRGEAFNKKHFTYGWKMVCKYWFVQKIIGFNRKVPWPCSPLVKIGDYKNISFDPSDISNFDSPGTYYQAINGRLSIGKGTQIAPGVGLICANHSLSDLTTNAPGKDISIGNNCWIGMNAVVLPGVTLGEGTIVGAGSIVTKSFEEGHCIIVGNPARKIKSL